MKTAKEVLYKHTRELFSMNCSLYEAENDILKAMEEYALISGAKEENKEISSAPEELWTDENTMEYRFKESMFGMRIMMKHQFIETVSNILHKHNTRKMEDNEIQKINALKAAEDDYNNSTSPHYRDNERFSWVIETINKAYQK